MTTFRRFRFAAGCLLVLLGGQAAASDELPAVTSPASAATIPRGGDRWQAAIGLRMALFRDAGYDPFSTNDAFPQLAVSASRVIGGGSAVGIAYDRGSASENARGADATLTVTRLSLTLEERVALHRHVYLFARLAPGIAFVSAKLADPSAPASLSGSFIALSGDASGGAALRINTTVSPVSVWLVGEGGYGFIPRHSLSLGPELPTIDRDKMGQTDLGSLSLRGPFLRFSLALSY
jgi:hypothetical protein